MSTNRTLAIMMASQMAHHGDIDTFLSAANRINNFLEGLGAAPAKQAEPNPVGATPPVDMSGMFAGDDERNYAQPNGRSVPRYEADDIGAGRQ